MTHTGSMRIPGIKRLYTFMLQTFLPLFMMTFFITLFIVMMQFVWSHLDDMVGKGLGIDLLSELFFYAALVFVPMALPLAILLASLMTFGNLGEHVELTAMKSSGISLLRVMSPLVVFIAMIAIGAFFFQNDVLPKAQVKMWTLLFSMRQKTPTLDIPEGTVYNQIPGYNLYVGRKDHADKESGKIYDIVIYGMDGSMNHPRVVAADSGRISMTEDKLHLVLQLYHGNWYEEVKGGGPVNGSTEMFRRESFQNKTILIPYDATFTRMNDDAMRSQYVGKNITELLATIDSVQARVDSVGDIVSSEMRAEPIAGMPSVRTERHDSTIVQVVQRPMAISVPTNIDSLFGSLPEGARQAMLTSALANLEMRRQNYQFRSYVTDDDKLTIRRHNIELQRKFTLSLACLIFFFIGAPLGAIIRKGGLGTPIVISVILFIIYYMIDNSGYKLARDARWPVWQGVWLSSAVLLPLGIFLTKKSIDDSAVFNIDAYRNFFARLFGKHQTRQIALKEVVVEEVDTQEALSRLASLRQATQAYLERYKRRQSYREYWLAGYDKPQLQALSRQIDDTVDYLANSREQLVLNKAMDFPLIRQLFLYRPGCGITWLGWAGVVLFPVGLPCYLLGTRLQKNLKRELSTTLDVCDQMSDILTGKTSNDISIEAPAGEISDEELPDEE